MSCLSVPVAEVSKPPRPQQRRQVPDRLFTNPRPNEPVSADAAAHAVFDPEAALARMEENRERLGQMVGLFAMHWRKLAAEIAKAGQNRDGATLELSAHKLRLSVGSMGAAEASRVAQELEARGRHGEFPGVDRVCSRLEMALERLVTALKEFARELVPSA